MSNLNNNSTDAEIKAAEQRAEQLLATLKNSTGKNPIHNPFIDDRHSNMSSRETENFNSAEATARRGKRF
ncbi:MAG: hypothetical protein ACXVNM_11885 [Bacteroidia bacterium]